MNNLIQNTIKLFFLLILVFSVGLIVNKKVFASCLGDIECGYTYTTKRCSIGGNLCANDSHCDGGFGDTCEDAEEVTDTAPGNCSALGPDCNSDGDPCTDPWYVKSGSCDVGDPVPTTPPQPTTTTAPGQPTSTPAPTDGPTGCDKSCSNDADCGPGWICAPETDKCWSAGGCAPSSYGCNNEYIYDKENNITYADNFSSCLMTTDQFEWKINPTHNYLVDRMKFRLPEVGYEHHDQDKTKSSYYLNIRLRDWVPLGDSVSISSKGYDDQGDGTHISFTCSNGMRVTNSCPTQDATCEGYNFPASMYSGDTEAVQVTMQNAGTLNWTRADSYKLGFSSTPSWGTLRADLSSTDNITLGNNKAFNFDVTAPSVPGRYKSKWRMLQEGVTAFGDHCGPDVVTVAPSCPSDLELTCTSSNALRATWTSAQTSVDSYNVRVHHDYQNNAECIGGGGTPVGWYCGDEGDQFLVASDPDTNSSTDVITKFIMVEPGVEYLIDIQSSAPDPSGGADIWGCNINQTITCQDIRGEFYTGEGATSGGFGNYCSATDAVLDGPVASASLDAESLNGGDVTYTNIDDTNHSYILSVSDQGTYNISYDPGDHPDPSHAFTLNCPAGGTYYDVEPGDVDVNFFITDNDLSNNAWWQVSGGSVFAAGNTKSDVPESNCAAAYALGQACYPGLIARSPFGSPDALDTNGFVFAGGSIDTHKDTSDQIDYVHTPGSRSTANDADKPNNAHAFGATLPEQNYEYFFTKFGANAVNTTDTDYSNLNISTTETNIFAYDATSGDLVIDNTDGWYVGAGEKVIVFVNGNLRFTGSTAQIVTTVRKKDSGNAGGYLAFIVSGNIYVSEEVGYDLPGAVGSLDIIWPNSAPPNMEGVFIADGTIDIEDDGEHGTGTHSSPDKKFFGAGSFVGWSGINLYRDFDEGTIGRADNNTNPTETFIYRPDFVFNTPVEMKTSQSNWKEVAPTF